MPTLITLMSMYCRLLYFDTDFLIEIFLIDWGWGHVQNKVFVLSYLTISISLEVAQEAQESMSKPFN